ncbi:hypothetical protein H2201_005786 [Coniosporium apollinis]|uniref:RRM domain-containing protein n=1 Tax=Coniosporium apollinis TaxID=61459 RepID=A0ABQ9NP28_9PEZI|nr:hypothetical protein H2201_005786 [Coniosporium apollinis]
MEAKGRRLAIFSTDLGKSPPREVQGPPYPPVIARSAEVYDIRQFANKLWKQHRDECREIYLDYAVPDYFDNADVHLHSYLFLWKVLHHIAAWNLSRVQHFVVDWCMNNRERLPKLWRTPDVRSVFSKEDVERLGIPFLERGLTQIRFALKQLSREQQEQFKANNARLAPRHTPHGPLVVGKQRIKREMGPPPQPSALVGVPVQLKPQPFPVPASAMHPSKPPSPKDPRRVVSDEVILQPPQQVLSHSMIHSHGHILDEGRREQAQRGLSGVYSVHDTPMGAPAMLSQVQSRTAHGSPSLHTSSLVVPGPSRAFSGLENVRNIGPPHGRQFQHTYLQAPPGMQSPHFVAPMPRMASHGTPVMQQLQLNPSSQPPTMPMPFAPPMELARPMPQGTQPPPHRFPPSNLRNITNVQNVHPHAYNGTFDPHGPTFHQEHEITYVYKGTGGHAYEETFSKGPHRNSFSAKSATSRRVSVNAGARRGSFVKDRSGSQSTTYMRKLENQSGCGRRDSSYQFRSRLLSQATEPFPTLDEARPQLNGAAGRDDGNRVNFDAQDLCGIDFIGTNREDAVELWIHNIRDGVTERELAEAFEQVAQVVVSTISFNRDRNERLYAFVHMHSSGDARKGLALHGYNVRGAPLTVQVAQKYYEENGRPRVYSGAEYSTMDRSRQDARRTSFLSRPRFGQRMSSGSNTDRPAFMSRERTATMTKDRRMSTEYTLPPNAKFSPQDARSDLQNHKSPAISTGSPEARPRQGRATKIPKSARTTPSRSHKKQRNCEESVVSVDKTTEDATSAVVPEKTCTPELPSVLPVQVTAQEQEDRDLTSETGSSATMVECKPSQASSSVHHEVVEDLAPPSLDAAQETAQIAQQVGNDEASAEEVATKVETSEPAAGALQDFIDDALVAASVELLTASAVANQVANILQTEAEEIASDSAALKTNTVPPAEESPAPSPDKSAGQSAAPKETGSIHPFAKKKRATTKQQEKPKKGQNKSRGKGKATESIKNESDRAKESLGSVAETEVRKDKQAHGKQDIPAHENNDAESPEELADTSEYFTPAEESPARNADDGQASAPDQAEATSSLKIQTDHNVPELFSNIIDLSHDGEEASPNTVTAADKSSDRDNTSTPQPAAATDSAPISSVDDAASQVPPQPVPVPSTVTDTPPETAASTPTRKPKKHSKKKKASVASTEYGGAGIEVPPVGLGISNTQPSARIGSQYRMVGAIAPESLSLFVPLINAARAVFPMVSQAGPQPTDAASTGEASVKPKKNKPKKKKKKIAASTKEKDVDRKDVMLEDYPPAKQAPPSTPKARKVELAPIQSPPLKLDAETAFHEQLGEVDNAVNSIGVHPLTSLPQNEAVDTLVNYYQYCEETMSLERCARTKEILHRDYKQKETCVDSKELRKRDETIRLAQFTWKLKKGASIPVDLDKGKQRAAELDEDSPAGPTSEEGKCDNVFSSMTTLVADEETHPSQESAAETRPQTPPHTAPSPKPSTPSSDSSRDLPDLSHFRTLERAVAEFRGEFMPLELPRSPAPLSPIADPELEDKTKVKMTWAQMAANAGPKKNIVANVIMRSPKRTLTNPHNAEESWAPLVQPVLKQAGRGMGHKVEVVRGVPRKEMRVEKKEMEAPSNNPFEKGLVGKGRESANQVPWADAKVREATRRDHFERKRREEESRRQDSMDPSSSQLDTTEESKRGRQRQQRQKAGQSSSEEPGTPTGQAGGVGAGRSTGQGEKKH